MNWATAYIFVSSCLAILSIIHWLVILSLTLDGEIQKDNTNIYCLAYLLTFSTIFFGFLGILMQ